MIKPALSSYDTNEDRCYLHERNVIHRDIKSTNFMVDKKWTCKVGDLGISTIRSDLIKRKTIVGTPGNHSFSWLHACSL